jgi:hypothetical protein
MHILASVTEPWAAQIDQSMFKQNANGGKYIRSFVFLVVNNTDIVTMRTYEVDITLPCIQHRIPTFGTMIQLYKMYFYYGN